MDVKVFSYQEVMGLQPSTVTKLLIARLISSVPFVITSGKRTPEANAGLSGAVGDSSHLTGNAVDLHVADDAHFKALIAGLLAAGFTRLGLYYSVEGTKLIPRHIHVDDDPTKPQNCIWSLIEQN